MPTRLHFIMTDSSLWSCPEVKVPSNMREIAPDFIGTKGIFISTECSFIKRSSDSTSISESVYGALSVNVFKYCNTSSVKSG